MDFRDTLHCRIISLVVLFTFCWTFVGGADMAHAFKNGFTKSNAPTTLKKEKSTEARLSETIDSIESVLEDESLDIKGKRDRLKAKKADLIGFDKKMRRKFKDTEAHLKDKGMPQAILDRQKAFVKHYEDNYRQLSDSIDTLSADIPASEFKDRVHSTLEHLKKVKPPKKHVPLNPEKLPHRSAIEKKAKKEKWVAPKPIKFDLGPIKKKSGLERPEIDSPYASLYEPFEDAYPITQEAPILIAANGSLSGLTAGSIAQNTPPSAEDLAETIDVKFTPAIMTKAAELANTPQAKSGALPIAIYEWVRNNVEYVPTWGSIQGADHCLQTMKCNSFDTSSLLIALFRANGIHARYATVTGEMKVERFMNWMGGFTNATAALDFAATGGMPLTGLVDGGKIKAARFEQVIVEGWVDMEPSFGAKHKQGDTWIRFDPSFKEYTYTQGMDISETVPFDAEGLVNNLISTAVINETEGYVTGIDSSIINTAMSDYRAQVEQYMSTEQPDATVGDVLGTKKIIKHEFPVLMGTLPFKTKTVHARYREIPAELRHTITFSVAPTESNYYVEPFSITKSLPEIAGKKITLSYSPATQADEDVINSYLPTPHADGTPIDPSELPTSLPAYLINLKPELRIDGNVVATGGAITMGSAENVKMTFHDPVRGNDIVTNIIEAGEYWGIAVDAGNISDKQIEATQAILKSTILSMNEGINTNISREKYLGDVLFFTALTYLNEYHYMNELHAKRMDVVSIGIPSEAVFKYSLNSDYSFGIPINSSGGLLKMDVDRLLDIVKHRDGSDYFKKIFTLRSGMNSSTLEHSLPEKLFDIPGYSANGISAIKAIEIAANQGVPLYYIDRSNFDVVKQELSLGDSIVQQIENAINSGKFVLAPKSDVTSDGWTGSGFIVIDPQTGAGAYMLSSGDNGAAIIARIILFVAFGPASLLIPICLDSPHYNEYTVKPSMDTILYLNIQELLNKGIFLYPMEYIVGAITMYVFYQQMKANRLPDKYSHCMAGCVVARYISPDISYNLLYYREFADEFHGWLRELDGQDAGHKRYSVKDMEADIYGITCPEEIDCETHCLDYPDINDGGL